MMIDAPPDWTSVRGEKGVKSDDNGNDNDNDSNVICLNDVG